MKNWMRVLALLTVVCFAFTAFGQDTTTDPITSLLGLAGPIVALLIVLGILSFMFGFFFN